jgi:DNA repair protein RadC
MTTIANTPIKDRPREKLLANGAECLTESELLAIILATSGQKGVSVLDIAKGIIIDAKV